MDNRFRSAALAQAQGRLDAAEAAYRALLADDAENAAAIRANLAAIAVARGDGAAAEAEARAALAESEDDANGWNALGLGLKMQGRAKPAVDAFRAAVAVDPRHAEAWANLGGLLAATGDRDAALKATSFSVTSTTTYYA